MNTTLSSNCIVCAQRLSLESSIECGECHNRVCEDCSQKCGKGCQSICECKDEIYCNTCLTAVVCCDNFVCSQLYAGYGENDEQNICSCPDCSTGCTNCEVLICAEDCSIKCKICCNNFCSGEEDCSSYCDICDESFCNECINLDKHKCSATITNP